MAAATHVGMDKGIALREPPADVTAFTEAIDPSRGKVGEIFAVGRDRIERW
jgi:hypothetical protein